LLNIIGHYYLSNHSTQIYAVAAPPAIKKLNERFPGYTLIPLFDILYNLVTALCRICVYTGAMEQIVNEKW
jgi:hypothetical protein